MACYNIMTILISHRSKNAPDVQKVLTKYGCIIKVRLGLHEAEYVCADEGLIIVQLSGDKKDMQEFENELNSIEGVTAKTIEICS